MTDEANMLGQSGGLHASVRVQPLGLKLLNRFCNIVLRLGGKDETCGQVVGAAASLPVTASLLHEARVLWDVLLLPLAALQMIRLCNSIHKRLGKHDVIHRARLLMLIASCTPLFDRSGVNVMVCVQKGAVSGTGQNYFAQSLFICVCGWGGGGMWLSTVNCVVG